MELNKRGQRQAGAPNELPEKEEAEESPEK